MRILGIPVSPAIRECAFLEHYAALFSKKVNRLPESAKKRLIIGFILLCVAVLGGNLMLEIFMGNTTSLRIPAWEPPLIYFDSLDYEPKTINQ
ncbi:hypothetical protein SAMN04489724_0119 [Algoriphagus locisalis]|uniref:Uncharacterized protein n=1 Tax=Algoriphagus locisalis TaxID=305507 RepID=A0A1I7E5X3_9BACT|nr:hypothetical protein SAMN04489724_0119 [Algoriphagus locisalis]